MSQKRKKILIICIGLMLTMFMVWFQLTSFPIIKRLRYELELFAYDAAIQLFDVNYKEKDVRVVIVDIDDKSIQTVGRWPWPRDKLATVVDKLSNAGAVLLAFDITFSDPETNIAEVILKEVKETKPNDKKVISYVQELVPQFNNDQKFKSAITQIDTVLGYVFHNNLKLNSVGKLSPPFSKLDKNISERLVVHDMQKYRASLADLVNVSIGGGFLTIFPDSDGLLRHAPLILKHNDGLYPSLALEAVKQYLLLDEIKVSTSQLNDTIVINDILLGEKSIPVDQYGQVFIPFSEKAKNTLLISALDVLNNKYDPKSVQDAIVIIGSTSLTLGDLHATPKNPTYPGIKVHANIIHGLLAGYFPHYPSWAKGAELLATLALGLTCSLLFPFLSALLTTGLTLVFGLSVIYGDFLLLRDGHIVLSVISPVLLLVLIAISNLTLGYFFEGRVKSKLTALFGQYIPSELVEQMSQSPDNYHLESETKELTVLFSDIRNFTSISESISGDQVKLLLNTFFTPITAIIFKHHGTIDKYVGDMVMAFWGAPVKIENQSASALYCALEMIKATKALKGKFAKLGLPEVKIGIGINTGLMNVGDMGSDFRRSYTVLGNAVNLGSRLEGLSKQYGVDIVVGEETMKGNSAFIFIHLDKVRVKGMKKPCDIYALICCKDELSMELDIEIKAYQKAINLYFAEKFNEALRMFKKLKEKHPNKQLYKLYIDRIESLISNPKITNWDGVFDWKTK